MLKWGLLLFGSAYNRLIPEFLDFLLSPCSIFQSNVGIIGVCCHTLLYVSSGMNAGPHASVALSLPPNCLPTLLFCFSEMGSSHVAFHLPCSCLNFLVMIFFLKCLFFLVISSTKVFILAELLGKHSFKLKT